MHWDRKRHKWTSVSQQRRDEKREQMALFRKKSKEPVVSAFDQIPLESQAKLVEDIMTICRILREWPSIIPKELHAQIGKEVMTMLRQSGMKLAGILMSDDENTDDMLAILAKIPLPNFGTQVIHAIKQAFTRPTETNNGQNT